MAHRSESDTRRSAALFAPGASGGGQRTADSGSGRGDMTAARHGKTAAQDAKRM